MQNYHVYCLRFIPGYGKKKRNSSKTSSKSSHSACISLDYIYSIIDQMKMSTNRLSTRLNYHTVWTAFNKFLIRLDRQPRTWEEKTAAWMAYLAKQGKKSTTLKSYISAIKCVLTQDGYNWSTNEVLLSTLTKSCRETKDIVTTRLPIREKLLQLIVAQLNDLLNTQHYLLIMYRCFFMLQYYGLMRVGELASGAHPVLAKDIHSADNKDKILLILYSSKTHGKESSPQHIKITANSEADVLKRQTIFCPFTATRDFLSLRGSYQTDLDPLFIFRDGTPVKPRHVRQILKSVLVLLNLDASLYGTHSFRIGRATDLTKDGFSVEEVKRLGRWKSNAVYKYIK